MKKHLRFTKTDSTKSDTEFGKNNKTYLVAESEEENSEFYKTLANFGEVGQIIGANRKETQDLENLIKSYEQEKEEDKEITADQKEEMDKTISDAKNATMELNQKLNKELIPRYKFLGDGIEAEYSNLTANLNATQTLADQNGQYAIGNQTLWQDAEQNYTDLHKKYQMTDEQLIKFESLFNQTKEDLNQCKINLNTTQTLADQNGQYAIGNQTLWQDAEQNYTDLHKKHQITDEQLIKFESLFNQTKEDLNQCKINLNTTQTLADQCNENLNSENKEISDLNSYLAGNQSDYNNELSSLGKKLKKEQGYAKTEERIIHRYRTEYNITGPLSNHNSEKNKHLIEGAVIGAGGASLLFIAGALLHYKFSKKKPLFQQTIDELVDTEVLALIKFMDEKMKEDEFDFHKKVEIIKIFDSEFNPPSDYNFNDIKSRWKELSTSFLGIYDPESRTRYSTAYKKLFENAKALNSINEEEKSFSYILKPENIITFNKIFEPSDDLNEFNDKEIRPGKVQQAIKLNSISQKFKQQ